ncbi:MAG: EAL domain-containing protein [Marinomonas sp.]
MTNVQSKGDFANTLLAEQVSENFRYASTATAAGVFNAVLLTAAFWSHHNHYILLAWLAAILGAALIRFRNIRGIDPRKETPEVVDKHANLIHLSALMTGTIWGLGIAYFSSHSSYGDYVLLIMICSGMMGASVTTYTSMGRAGALFIMPLAMGGAMALLNKPDVPLGPALLLLACYAALLLRGGHRREAQFATRIKTREELRTSGETVQLLLNDFESQSSDWLWNASSDGQIIAPSDRFSNAAGRAPELLADMHFIDLFEQSPERHILVTKLTNSHGFRNLTLELQVNDEPHWWTISAQPDGLGGMRGVASDVTSHKQAEKRISYMAHYDGLTDLANRYQFNEALKRHLHRHRRGTGKQLSVLFLDLDFFKSVNDALGHPVGDGLLCEAARRIEKTVGEQDFVARLGGDEFAVLLYGEDANARSEDVAAQIVETLAEPFEIEGHAVVISSSIGVAHYQDGLKEPAELMKRADQALYSAKEDGRNRFALFAPEMDESAQNRRRLELDLRAAIGANEFELYYQPLINIETNETVAYEALIRWNHPERGVVMPDDFIPLAEETGLIVQLGEWVIRNAIHDATQWPETIRVSVNLSPAQMRSAALIGVVVNALASSGLSPDRLELEITENVLLQGTEVNIATLHKLRDLGIRISLDDFGTGYSSLNYLRKFPFDKIKIDRCFVNELEDNPDCLAIIRAVTDLARSLGMTTTAEGVEDPAQLDTLRGEGCHEAQGFLFSKATKLSELTDLREKRALVSNPTLPLPLHAKEAQEAKDAKQAEDLGQSPKSSSQKSA